MIAGFFIKLEKLAYSIKSSMEDSEQFRVSLLPVSEITHKANALVMHVDKAASQQALRIGRRVVPSILHEAIDELVEHFLSLDGHMSGAMQVAAIDKDILQYVRENLAQQHHRKCGTRGCDNKARYATHREYDLPELCGLCDLQHNGGEGRRVDWQNWSKKIPW